jgi:hypothetical protein
VSGYNANHPDAAAFAKLIEPWLRARDLSLDVFSQLHFALDQLQYKIFADRSGISIPAPRTLVHVKCSSHNCETTSATPDACILNFAARGAEPKWFCRKHHPNSAGLPPPGWTPDLESQKRTREATMTAWNKLTSDERPLLNRNIVGTASKGD